MQTSKTHETPKVVLTDENLSSLKEHKKTNAQAEWKSFYSLISKDPS